MELMSGVLISGVLMSGTLFMSFMIDQIQKYFGR